MAQTRKKRRSKHRGTAAGTIEARGRTGRKPTEQERKAGVRAQAGQRRAHRLDTPPTWRSAFYRALFASVLLFALTRLPFFNVGEVSLGASLLLCLVALVIYVPLGFATDQFVYNRRQKRKAALAQKARG